MPVLDTVVLFAAADKEDQHHRVALDYLRRIAAEDYWVAAFALFEFDVVMKSRGFSFDERMENYSLMIKDFPKVNEKVLSLDVEGLYLTAKIEKERGIDYFDAGVASQALRKDGVVVSTDIVFDEVPNLRRVW